MEDEQILRKKRGQIKAHITRFNTYLDKWSSDKDTKGLELKMLKHNHANRLNEYQTIQGKIELLDNNKDEEDPLIFEEIFIATMARASEMIDSVRQDTTLNSTVISHNLSTPCSEHQLTPQLLNYKLPELPKFYGNIKKWADFYTNFEAGIHQNKGLTDIQRFQYLRDLVRGEAYEKIKSLTLTEANYDKALQRLKDTYEDPRRVIFRNWLMIQEQPPLKHFNRESLQRLIDSFQTSVANLESAGVGLAEWKELSLIMALAAKLDSKHFQNWDRKQKDKKGLPKFRDFVNYLVNKVENTFREDDLAEIRRIDHSKSNTYLEEGQTSKETFRKKAHKSRQSFNKKNQVMIINTPKPEKNNNVSNQNCSFCRASHFLYQCPGFKQLNPNARQKHVTEHGICKQCLLIDLPQHRCKAYPCRFCRLEGNYLLHDHQGALNETSTTRVTPNTSNQPVMVIDTMDDQFIVTAKVNIQSRQGTLSDCRIILDSGAATNLISEELTKKLGLRIKGCATPFYGCGEMENEVLGLTSTNIYSKTTDFKERVVFRVVRKICGLVPSEPINTSSLILPKEITLADPSYNIPGEIHMLLGSGYFMFGLKTGQHFPVTSGPERIMLQETVFGWVFGIRFRHRSSTPRTTLINYNTFNLQQFWELEELPFYSTTKVDQSPCETHFQENTMRAADDRYMVALPFNHHKGELGESIGQARRRYRNLTNKFRREPEFKEKYSTVLQEYLDLGHMSPVDPSENDAFRFFLPHHAVFKASSTTTAVRIVFDASAKSTSGLSLNNVLFTGPTIQPELFSTLLRFRKHKYVLTGDIEKMYRQFWIRPEDRKYQSIIWHNQKGEETIFQLNTVTFGINCAPYLAIRCLHQIAQDGQREFPSITNIISEDFYVDDLLTGDDDLEHLLLIRNQINILFKRYKLKMRQWASNSTFLLKDLAPEDCNKEFHLKVDTAIKTLGLKWHSVDDTIGYDAPEFDQDALITKRYILSNIARLFDPLGLLSPVFVRAKLLLQELWLLKLGWDEAVPLQIQLKWEKHCQDLNEVRTYRVPRHVLSTDSDHWELIGFCDASLRAYGACVYLRSGKKNQSRIRLLCAKSKVAPLDKQTIPRLELCGALLLTKLIVKVQNALKYTHGEIYCWTDSTIVLGWLHIDPHILQIFVSNRICEILKIGNNIKWAHVRSEENPADLISRGASPKELMESSLWNQGPSWLTEPPDQWPRGNERINVDEIPEIRKVRCLIVQPIINFPYHNFSKIQILVRTIAICKRFVPGHRVKGIVTFPEYKKALNFLLMIVQRETFSEERNQLKKGRPLDHNNHLVQLNPFLGPDGLLRVGGRLKNALQSYDIMHPILLPKNHHVTDLIIRNCHKEALHAGPQTTLYLLRSKFWIISGRGQVKRILRQCVHCLKQSPGSITTLMGDLPVNRVSQAAPFTNTGVDYCGPISIKEKKFYNKNFLKVYVAIFVCFTTKAVHLELVRDLSADGFTAALRRFVSRRGLCKNLYSDNGTNFVGCHNDLRRLYHQLSLKEVQDQINQLCTTKSINWHFIPARSPHFGGLWEAAVKSFKHHLRRVAGNNIFIYDELLTLIIEIEGILNSRPLCPMSSDPNDLRVLSPFHFLTGATYVGLPTPDYTDVPTGRLDAWQHLQLVKQHLWKRWQEEYLNELTRRTKWNTKIAPIKEGQIVLLKDEDLPPGKWKMGRIINVYPGPDGIVRVVRVKTAGGEYKRAVTRLAPLLSTTSTNDIAA